MYLETHPLHPQRVTEQKLDNQGCDMKPVHPYPLGGGVGLAGLDHIRFYNVSLYIISYYFHDIPFGSTNGFMVFHMSPIAFVVALLYFGLNSIHYIISILSS